MIYETSFLLIFGPKSPSETKIVSLKRFWNPWKNKKLPRNQVWFQKTMDSFTETALIWNYEPKSSKTETEIYVNDAIYQKNCSSLIEN